MDCASQHVQAPNHRNMKSNGSSKNIIALLVTRAPPNINAKFLFHYYIREIKQTILVKNEGECF